MNKITIILTIILIFFSMNLFAKEFAIFVGINNYEYLNNLIFAEKDAEDLDDLFSKLGYETKLLTGAYIGSDTIIGTIKTLSRKSRSEDTLIFFFSGHGAPGDDENKKGLMTHYSDPEDVLSIITQERLKNALNSFKGTTIVVLDACYQGSQYKNMRRDDTTLNRKLADSVDFLITSSAGNQESHDGFFKGNKHIENGIAAYYLKIAVNGEADSDRNNVISSYELKKYFTGYAQHMAAENDQDMEINCDNNLTKLIVIGETTGSNYVPSSIAPEQVLVKGGSFQMGSMNGDDDEKFVHEVTLTYDYWMGKYEVTFDEYDRYCEETGKIKPDEWREEYKNGNWVIGADMGRGKKPVIHVSWNDAIQYCNWLSEKEAISKAYDSEGNLMDRNGNRTTDIMKVEGYRLPSEAEWEYAARGGNKNKKCTYSGSNNIEEVGWYNGNSEWETHEVGEKGANELGLYDISGNVWEWCQDWYKYEYYGKSKSNDHVIRGGSWSLNATFCRVANRGSLEPTGRGCHLGFRIARTSFF